TSDSLRNYYEHYFRKLSENGGNFTRVWLSVPLLEIEHLQPGAYDRQIAARIDTLLSLARKYEIRVKFCLEHFRKITGAPAPFAGSVPFDRPVYAGHISDMDDFFTSSTGKRFYLDRVKFLADRYGDHPSVFGWELWNEINAVSVTDKAALLNWTTD